METSLHDQVRSLLATLAEKCSGGGGFGSMSSSIYDTAWVSMVQNPKPGTVDPWLFPECFDFILTCQLPSGAWESYSSPVDGILNTAASLLALKKHLKTCPDRLDWELRSQKAEAALRHMLDDLDTGDSDQVGFEMIIIQHLSLLEEEGVKLDSPQLISLRALREAKLAKLPPESVYQSPSTLYHSLEALIGHIDFDQVRCWRDTNGSLMGSPASTAAYLMHSSTWDDQAEAYLRNVLRQGAGHGDGSVPSAWPSSVFEISWTITTLVRAGIEPEEETVAAMRKFLQETLNAHGGTLGFYPGCFPDADDTAKGIEAIRLLGRTTVVDALTMMFEADDHFKTYPGERNPSLSANCNVLIALLVQDDPALHMSQIAKAASYVTSQVFSGPVNEKWHIKELYWMMLLSQAYAVLYQQSRIWPTIHTVVPSLKEDIPLVTLHLLINILYHQQKSGGWESGCEVTSYAVLALSSLSTLPWIRKLDAGFISTAMTRGISFLLSRRCEWTKGKYIWVEKVTYASNTLAEAYCLAAALVPLPAIPAKQIPPSHGLDLPDELIRGMRKVGDLLAQTPLFAYTEPHVLRIAEMQASYAFCALRRQPLEVFTRTAKGKDKYMSLIPLALTACSAVQEAPVSFSILYQMMQLSILNFHADEYMEGVVEKLLGDDLDAVKPLIGQLFADLVSTRQAYKTNAKKQNAAVQNHAAPLDPNGKKLAPLDEFRDDGLEQPTSLEHCRMILNDFVDHILHNSAVLSCPHSFQTRLAFELKTFLLAHVSHAEDNRRFGRQDEASTGHYGSNSQSNGSGTGSTNGQRTPELSTPARQFQDPGRTFYHWVRSTSADHTSCPFSFVFFNCLVKEQARPGDPDISTSARTAYLSEDLCRHLASLCRMYNDYGSLARDAEERNLNSVNFPEFHSVPALTRGKEVIDAQSAETKAKSELLWIAEYERRGLETALELFGQELGTRGQHLFDALKLFVNVTDLYGQVYVLRDVGTRTK
ncbi:Uu.00g020740.m01.CDS01 [Anthostomella pinea]|uniref:Uu.00g020740.m01.CDS01 n=1 Tax=Anthostomella pinea TaxID=933095 RepID=A0AAI8YQV2_9PEZI|nr:Uu.00g020740.m01.CDS01 [Anthostomella pinea]